MNVDGRQSALKELRQIPGVGIKIVGELYNLGFRSIGDLKGCDPEELYGCFCAYNGHKVDRCVLYVMRCAVYFASRDKHEPELLKWWNWKYVEPQSAVNTSHHINII